MEDNKNNNNNNNNRQSHFINLFVLFICQNKLFKIKIKNIKM